MHSIAKSLAATAIIAGLCASVSFVHAEELEIGPVIVETFAVIATEVGDHQSGNMEIKLKDPFVIPSSSRLSCETTYITTRSSVNSAQLIANMLIIAQTARQPVMLRISDDAKYRAFPTRCSLIAVQLL